MDYIRILLSAVSAFAVLLILTRLMGRKQISELSLFDYVTGISIGSIAAEMATNLEQDILHPVIAMASFALLDIILSFAGSRSEKLEILLYGKPLVLFDNGRFIESNIKKAKLCVSDLLMEARINGYFNFSQVQSVVLETNGSLSILPVAMTQPVTAADMNISAQQEHLLNDVIYNGRVLDYGLKAAGKNREWLNKKLKEQGIGGKTDSIILATVDSQDALSVYFGDKTK